MARQAKEGDTVAVHYTGTLEDGSVFDSSDGRDPIEFEVGGGQIIPGFDQAVRGMEVGDKKEVTIPSDKAYGGRREDLEVKVPREQLPDGFEPQVGAQLAVEVAPGQQTAATITDVEPQAVQLDLNHPLAGRDLTFHLELVSIRGD